LETTRRVRIGAWQAWAAGAILLAGSGLKVQADVPAPPGAAAASAAASSDDGEPKGLPQDGLFSSIKQSLREGDREIIRGHFEVGSPPNVRRYYCLMDPKTHRREPNGVVGDPVSRPDGMTGINSSAVSLYRCDKAEQQGMLVTAGYVVPAHSAAPSASAQTAPAPPSPASPPAAALPSSAPPLPATAAAPVSRFSSGMVDISGVRLGMSVDEVRAVLKTKHLRDRDEWSETLSYRDVEGGKMQPVANGRFVNVIAASNSASAAAERNYEVEGESFEVMFTPVPGHERVMGIVHTVGYSPSNAIHERALEEGLVEKYGGPAGAGGLPQSATWLYQAGGTVALGDSCGRRGLLGGLGALRVSSPRENLALQRAADELEFEVQQCGTAIVTEDHHVTNGGSLRGERMVTRYTVTAYSPGLAAEGAAQAQALLSAAGHGKGSPAALPGRDSHAPDL
jgi:hypothetical protein